MFKTRLKQKQYLRGVLRQEQKQLQSMSNATSTARVRKTTIFKSKTQAYVLC